MTVTADALTRIYGNANPALTYTVGGQGLVNGDTLTGALATTAGLTSNVGSYAITQGSLAAGSNYELTYTGANLTVTARPLTVTADALSRIYGNANPALTFTVGGHGLVNGDTLSGALATTAALTSNVGTYAITQGSLAASSNYALTYTGANLTITARPLTITADALSRIYGNGNHALTFRVGGQGLVNGDTLTGALATTAGLTSNVGSYAITQGSLAAGSNYTLTYAGANLTVTARPLTVTADALTRIYGNVNPALTYTVGGQGLVNGDTLTGALATTAGLTSNVGSYAITQGTLAAGSNYALTYTGANLTVTARPLTITADALTRIYGDANPALTYTVGGDGLVNGDTLSGALATAAGLTSNVGSYAITQGSLAAGSNYALTYTGANLTVTARYRSRSLPMHSAASMATRTRRLPSLLVARAWSTATRSPARWGRWRG
ncbi:MBG domain-containing protein [Blastomonas sp. SL216]|nr:MBG domain-containing protein [Blastomonas sp. SL216]